MIYGEFAEIYDRLMDDVDYDAWAERYRVLSGLPAGVPMRVAECACGTGSLTTRFASFGWQVTGIDGSAAMLRIAEEKARAEGADVVLTRQDMRAFRIPKPADAVFCTCDGVNYLTRPEDVRAFFSAASGAMKPGAVLCFDFSSAYKLEKVLGNGFQGEERDGIAYLWQNRFDESRRVLTMDLTFFVREDDGRYRRFRETHHQRAHTQDEIRAWLTDAGFGEIAFFGEMRTDAPREKDLRIHVRAVKA